METLPFEFHGRALEVRMDRDHKSYVCHVWEGDTQVSSVPYTVSQSQVEAAEANGELDRVLEVAMAEVRDAVIEGELLV